MKETETKTQNRILVFRKNLKPVSDLRNQISELDTRIPTC